MNTVTSLVYYRLRPVPQCRRQLVSACCVSDLEPLELNKPVTHQEGIGMPFCMVNDENKILVDIRREEDQ